MAIALPAVVLDNSPPGNIILPTPLMGEYALPGMVLPTPLMGEYALPGMVLPTPTLTEAALSVLYFAPLGGVRVGGGADVALDPYMMSGAGGVLVGGVAEVSYVQVSISNVMMQGGVRVSGAGTVSVNWLNQLASGGVKISGAATVSTVTTTTSEIIMQGGVRVSGAATVLEAHWDETLTSLATLGSSALVSTQFSATAVSVGTLNGTYVVGTNSSPIVSSSVAFASTGSSPTIFWEVVTSSATIAGELGGIRVVGATVTGSVVLDGVVIGQASYQVSASSLAQILSGIQFVQDYWDGWAFNLNTGAASTYENFKFNSFARIGMNYYGCNSTGIYLLSGNSDAGVDIDATATLATSDLSTEKVSGGMVKNVPNVYITAKSAEKLLLTARVEGIENSYEAHVAKDPLAAVRVDLGKGARGTLWQLELANQNGADMEIESMQIDVAATTRRRR